MAFISVTYTFANSTTADATQVNQNFTDMINGTSDGTKDFNIGSLTVVGASAMSGAVTLGDGTPDDITVNGSLASTIPIKTNNSFNFGSSTLGLASVYLGSAGGLTTRLVGGATGSSWTMTLPTAVPAASGYVLQSTTGGVTSWGPVRRGPEARQNYGLSTSVNANAMTVNLLAGDGTTPSSTNSVDILFRNTTAATGTSELVSVTGSLSVVITSGASLGLKDNVAQYIWVWAMNNAGTIELCVSGSASFDQGSLQSSTAIGSGSDDAYTLYGTSGRASKPIRLLGRLKSTQTTAGTYASNTSEISLFSPNEKRERSEIWLYTANGYGSTNDKIRRWTTTGKNVGTAITYADSAANGASFTINEDGLYSISYVDQFVGSSALGISVNSNQLTTSIAGISAADVRFFSHTSAANLGYVCGGTLLLLAGDVVRCHTEGQGSGGNTIAEIFRITKVSD